eukprot:6843026-Pyramimonas_sp.AAC.1
MSGAMAEPQLCRLDPLRQSTGEPPLIGSCLRALNWLGACSAGWVASQLTPPAGLGAPPEQPQRGA